MIKKPLPKCDNIRLVEMLHHLSFVWHNDVRSFDRLCEQPALLIQFQLPGDDLVATDTLLLRHVGGWQEMQAEEVEAEYGLEPKWLQI